MFLRLVLTLGNLVLLSDNSKESFWLLDDAWKGYLKTWDQWNSQSFHGALPLETTRRPYSPSTEPPAARVNILMYVWLWPLAIKLNLSWKTEVSKSAWITLCHLVHDIITISVSAFRGFIVTWASLCDVFPKFLHYFHCEKFQ